MLLIDTQTLLWVSADESPLGATARAAIVEAADSLCCSAISFWEIAMLVDKRRLALGVPLHEFIQRVREQGGQIVDITAEIALAAGSLPGDIHGDPADRLIMATARALDCRLVTSDRHILGYAAAGHLRAIDARA